MKKRCKSTGILLLGLALLSGCGREDSGAYEKAMQALEEGNYVLAGQEFDQAQQKDDRQAEIARGRGILALAQGQYDRAEEFFEQAAEAAGKGNKSFVRDVKNYQAEACLAQGKTEEAKKICQDRLEEGPDSKAELLLGRIALEQGDGDSAAEHFARSVEEEQSYENYLAIYELYAAASMEADGAAILEKALTLVPASGADFCSQGQVYYLLAQMDQAKTSFSRAVDLGSTDAVPMMGRLYLENGEIQAARSMYQSYLENSSRNALAYNGLALCDIAEQNYDGALANISKGLETGDTAVRESLLLNEIAAYEYKLDFRTAKEKMEAFLAEYPENKEAVRENIFLQSR